MANPNSITVAGGAGPRLPPAPRELDGTPDPEVGRMVQEGAMRYHLETLRVLATEASAIVPLCASMGIGHTGDDRLPGTSSIPVQARPGCRSAGCRTLDRCLCECRACRRACRGRG